MSQSYDETFYEGQSHPESHPDSLYAVGKFMGLTPPDFRTARVLEMGTGCGINALSMACRFPDMSILAIDPSHEQIKFAQARAKKLGITSLSYETRSLEDLTPEDGLFDYIVCYGLFSWISSEGQSNLLKACHDYLTPHGLAFINYNVMPGWGTPAAVRELIRFHHKLRPQSRDKAFIARDAAALLGDGLRSAKGNHVAAFEDEILHIKRSPDYYLVHEYLSPQNIPVYFHEFISRAEATHLSYVGDAYISEMYPTEYRQKFRRRLMGLGSIEQSEQYLDFMRGRRFRNSIMCRSEDNMPNHFPESERCTGLYILCKDTVLADESLFPALEGPSESTLPEALVKALRVAASQKLGRIPITRDGVLDWADSASVKPEDLDEALADHLVELIKRGNIELYGSRPPCPEKVEIELGAYQPVASRLARIQIIEGQRWVSSTTGEVVSLDKRSRNLLHLMDGSRSLDTIAQKFIESLQETGWVCRKNGEVLESFEDIFAFLAPQIVRACETFRVMNLLEVPTPQVNS